MKQILLKNIPAKLSSMRQKEIAILKVSWHDVNIQSIIIIIPRLCLLYSPIFLPKDLRHPNIVELFDCYVSKLISMYRMMLMAFCM